MATQICGDFKCTINKHISPVQDPFPHYEDLGIKLNDGKEHTTVGVIGV